MSQFNFTKTEFGIYEFIDWKFPGYTTKSAYAGKIVDYIISAFPEKPHESEIALRLNISTRWLQQECKKSFGITYGELFRNVRVNAGVSLLYSSKLTYSQIAAVLKYSSEKHMIRDFRQTLNCSPSEVKKYLAIFNAKNIKMPNVMYLIKI